MSNIYGYDIPKTYSDLVADGQQIMFTSESGHSFSADEIYHTLEEFKLLSEFMETSDLVKDDFKAFKLYKKMSSE